MSSPAGTRRALALLAAGCAALAAGLALSGPPAAPAGLAAREALPALEKDVAPELASRRVEIARVPTRPAGGPSVLRPERRARDAAVTPADPDSALDALAAALLEPRVHLPSWGTHARALGRELGPEAFLERLREPGASVALHLSAAEALRHVAPPGTQAPPETLAVLRRAVLDLEREPWLARAAAPALGALGEPADHGALLALLALDPAPDARAVARLGLAEAPERAVLVPLAEIAAQGADPGAASVASALLAGRAGGEGVDPHLVEARRAAGRALAAAAPGECEELRLRRARALATLDAPPLPPPPR